MSFTPTAECAALASDGRGSREANFSDLLPALWPSRDPHDAAGIPHGCTEALAGRITASFCLQTFHGQARGGRTIVDAQFVIQVLRVLFHRGRSRTHNDANLGIRFPFAHPV